MQKLPLDPALSNTGADRRYGGDRRTKRISNIRWLFMRGRRSGLRRLSDRRNLHFMDYYSPKIFYALVLVLILSVVDALLTLWLLENGAVELNPVMAYFLDKGADAFMAVKYLLTSIAVIIAVVLHYAFVRYLRIQFGLLLHVFAGCFAAVVVWELVLVVWYVL